MATALRLSPADHGRPLTYEEFEAAESAPGYKYELIGGRLAVSPLPDMPANSVEDWLLEKLKAYTRSHPTALNFVTNKARVFVPGEEEETAPEPDLAGYRNYPLDRRFELSWRDVSPVLVVEVLSEDADKVLVRNVGLYLKVPSVKEYWVLDPRANPEEPTLKRHRRHGGRWQVKDFAFSALFTTRLLPGFELTINPRT